jgi:hypothetical protein
MPNVIPAGREGLRQAGIIIKQNNSLWLVRHATGSAVEALLKA